MTAPGGPTIRAARVERSAIGEIAVGAALPAGVEVALSWLDRA